MIVAHGGVPGALALARMAAPCRITTSRRLLLSFSGPFLGTPHFRQESTLHLVLRLRGGHCQVPCGSSDAKGGEAMERLTALGPLGFGSGIPLTAPTVRLLASQALGPIASC